MKGGQGGVVTPHRHVHSASSSTSMHLPSGTLPQSGHIVQADSGKAHYHSNHVGEHTPLSINITNLIKYVAHYILNKSKMFTASNVAHFNLNNFDVSYYKNNRMLSAVLLVVEMLKNIDFQGSYGIFSKTKV